MDKETEAQRGAVSGLRPHSKSAAELGLAPRPFISRECLSLALRRPLRNTHSSTFRPRESHHTSLTTGTRGAWGSGATILTSGTLRTDGRHRWEARTEGGRSGAGEGPPGERYLQEDQFCHPDQGCRGFRSDPSGEGTETCE